MATHRVSLLGNLTPDTTGRCFPYPLDAIAGVTNDVWKHRVFVFNNPGGGEAHGVYGSGSVPENYVGTATARLIWSTPATSGNARWRLTYRAVGGDDAESLDQASNQEQLSVTDAAPSAANERMTASFDLTDANLAAGDTLQWLLERLDDTGTDTIADVAYMVELELVYADA